MTSFYFSTVLICYGSFSIPCLSILSDLEGYIRSVSPGRRSDKNPYFDIQLKSQNNTTKARIMANESTNRSLFINKCTTKTPVKLYSINEADSGTIFYNSNLGSRISDNK